MAGSEWGSVGLRRACLGLTQLPILCGIYCNNGGSGANVILRNSAGDDGVMGGT